MRKIEFFFTVGSWGLPSQERSSKIKINKLIKHKRTLSGQNSEVS